MRRAARRRREGGRSPATAKPPGAKAEVKDMLGNIMFEVTENGRVALPYGEMDRSVTEGKGSFGMENIPPTESMQEKLMRWARFNHNLKELLKRRRK